MTSGDVYPTNCLREANGEVGRCEDLLRPSHGREGWGDGAEAGAKSLEVGNEKNADERRIRQVITTAGYMVTKEGADGQIAAEILASGWCTAPLGCT